MIKQAIHNKNIADEARQSGIKVYSSEEIFGDMRTVKDFAAFGVKNKEQLQTAHARLLLDFCNTQSFTPKEMEFYRLGLDSMMSLFDNCEADTRSYPMDNEQKSKKSVG